MLKMLISLKTRRLLGVQIVGEGATELIHIGQAVMNLKGTVDYFIENTFNYPTLAEAYKIAGLDAFNRMPIPDEFRVCTLRKRTKNRRLFHVGITSVLRRCAACFAQRGVQTEMRAFALAHPSHPRFYMDRRTADERCANFI